MDQALALSSSEAVYNWGQEARALCYLFSSFAVHLLGRPDEARRRADMGVACARSGHDAHLLSTAIQFESILLRWQGDVTGVRERAEQAEAISAENGLELWAPVTGWVRGWVRAQSGSFDEGLAEMKIHLDRYLESGTDASRTDYLAATAEVCCTAGDFDAGLELIQEAFEQIERTGERLVQAEVHRVHGLLLAARRTAQLGTSGSDKGVPSAAEEAIGRALVIAEAQGALAWKLRAALALYRVSAGRSRETDARAILSKVLDAFPAPNGLPEYHQAIEILGRRKDDQRVV
jgi:tetratricopeptide (TPR) repeat protein